MKKYTIDYGHGIAHFFTTEQDEKKAVNEFLKAAYTCFGIRKSITRHLVDFIEDEPMPEPYASMGGTHLLLHNGDEILFDATSLDEDGDWKKIKSEWDD